MPVSMVISFGILFLFGYFVILIVLHSNKELTAKMASMLSILLFISAVLFIWYYFALQVEIDETSLTTRIITVPSDDKTSESKMQIAVVYGNTINITHMFGRIFDDTFFLKVKYINQVRGGIEFEDAPISYSVVTPDLSEILPYKKPTKE